MPDDLIILKKPKTACLSANVGEITHKIIIPSWKLGISHAKFPYLKIFFIFYQRKYTILGQNKAMVRERESYTNINFMLEYQPPPPRWYT